MNKFLKFSKVIFIILSLSLINVSHAEENNFTSKINKCATCHTLTGNSITTIWPKLSEQHAGYMLKQLIEFKKGKNGDRYDPTMLGMLQGIDEKDMLELVEYFSKQPLEKKKVKVDKNDIIKGKDIYIFGDKENNIVACVGCHGFDGTGNKLANFPSLKWQHKDYILIQLKKFKTGERSNDVNSIMRDIASNMTDQQMNAIAAYISVIGQ